MYTCRSSHSPPMALIGQTSLDGLDGVGRTFSVQTCLGATVQRGPPQGGMGPLHNLPSQGHVVVLASQFPGLQTKQYKAACNPS